MPRPTWRESLDKVAAESPSPDSIHLGWWGFWMVVGWAVVLAVYLLVTA